MSYPLFIFLVVGSIVWTTLGAMFYFAKNKYVKRAPQRLVFLTVCGPLVWMFGIADIFFIFADGIYNKFELWLTKT